MDANVSVSSSLIISFPFAFGVIQIDAWALSFFTLYISRSLSSHNFYFLRNELSSCTFVASWSRWRCRNNFMLSFTTLAWFDAPWSSRASLFVVPSATAISIPFKKIKVHYGYKFLLRMLIMKSNYKFILVVFFNFWIHNVPQFLKDLLHTYWLSPWSWLRLKNLNLSMMFKMILQQVYNGIVSFC